MVWQAKCSENHFLTRHLDSSLFHLTIRQLYIELYVLAFMLGNEDYSSE